MHLDKLNGGPPTESTLHAKTNKTWDRCPLDLLSAPEVCRSPPSLEAPKAKLKGPAMNKGCGFH